MYSSYYGGGMSSASLLFLTSTGLAMAVMLFIAQWKLFEKAGEKGWKCLIPIYNGYIWYKLTWSTGIWGVILGLGALSLLTAAFPMLAVLIAITALILYIVSCHMVSLSYGKSGGFTAGLFFLPFIFYPVLAFGQSRYIGPKGVPVYGSRSDTAGPEKDASAANVQDTGADAAHRQPIRIMTVILLSAAVLFFLTETLISMMNYHILRGMTSSPLVGFRNYQRLFSDTRYSSSVFDSVLYGLGAALLSAGTGLAGAELGKTGSAARKAGITAGFLLAAVPRLFWESLFAGQDVSIAMIIVCGALPWCGLSLAAGALLSGRLGHSAVRTALIVPALRVIMLLNGQNGIFSLLSTPLSRSLDSVDFYLYNRGLAASQISLSASGYVVLALINLLFAIGGTVLLAVLVRNAERRSVRRQLKRSDAFPGVAAAMLLIAGGILTAGNAGSGISGSLMRYLPATLTEMLLASVIGFGLFLLIQYFAGKADDHGRFSRAIFVFTLLSLGQMWISKYLLVQRLSLVNTTLAVSLSWLLNPMTLALAAVMVLARPATDGECFRNALAVVMMALIWGIGDLRGSVYYLSGSRDLSQVIYRSYANTAEIAEESISRESIRAAAWGITMLLFALPLGTCIAMTCLSAGKD